MHVGTGQDYGKLVGNVSGRTERNVLICQPDPTQIDVSKPQNPELVQRIPEYLNSEQPDTTMNPTEADLGRKSGEAARRT